MTGNVFLSIEPSDQERHALSAALADASPGPRIPGRRVPPVNWHITLRFVGEIEDPQLDRLVHELSHRVRGDTGTVRCRGLGAFPRSSKATVVFAAVVDHDEVLTPLVGECEDACRSVGLEPDERSFVPHLTLARVRPPVDVRRLFRSFGEFEVPLAVETVSLMRSVPDGRGVRYLPIERFPLIGALS